MISTMHIIPLKGHSRVLTRRMACPGKEGERTMTNTSLRSAIVTGASRGIGSTVAKRLARDGFAIVVNYAGNAAKAGEVVAEIKAAGGQAIAVQADVANVAEVESLFKQTQETFGRIDVVVKHSRIMPLSPIAEGDVASFGRVIATNLRGGFMLRGRAARHISECVRSIAFSGSVLAQACP